MGHNIRMKISLSEYTDLGEMDIFDTNPPAALNKDIPVLCHEIGHAVTWFSFGEAIGPLKLRRDSTTNQLKASVVLWPRDGNLQSLNSHEYAEPLAERLLAGDSAARKKLSLMTDNISIDGVTIDAITNIYGIIKQLDIEHDASKVLQLAYNAAHSNWHSWGYRSIGSCENNRGK